MCPKKIKIMKKLLIIAAFLTLPFLVLSLNINFSWNINLELLAGRKFLFIFQILENENQLTTGYAHIETTFAPVALETIGDWILKQTK